MTVLWLASLASAVLTIILNAHAGFVSAKPLEYAVLFAALYAALDIAKCSLIVAASKAWQSRAYGIAILCVVCFPFFFASSVWNAVTQVAVSRDEGKAEKVRTAQTRSRTDADHQRLTTELAVMQTSPTFTATAACALPKSKDARTFCTTVQTTKDALTTASTQLAATPATDPEPHVTWVATMLGIAPQPIQFTSALLPVLLAEVLGSIGFYISSRIARKAPERPPERVSWWRPVPLRSARRKLPEAPLEPSAVASPQPAPLNGVTPPAPTLTWKIPKAS